MNAEQLAKKLRARKSGSQWMANCPAHDDKTPSLAIRDGNSTVLFHCHAGCTQQQVIDALTNLGIFPADGPGGSQNTRRAKTPASGKTKPPRLRATTPHPDASWEPLTKQPQALAPPFDPNTGAWMLPHKRLGTPSATWAYHTAAAGIAGYACRFEHNGGGKEILPLAPCRNTKTRTLAWRWAGLKTPRPLYRLPELLAEPHAPVLVLEGEKTADAAAILFPDSAATTSCGGANSAHHTDWNPLAGRTVIIVPDNDHPGHVRAAAVARHAHAAQAAAVFLLEWPLGHTLGHSGPTGPSLVPRAGGPPLHWDLADAIAEGWTPELVARLGLPACKLKLIEKSFLV